MIEIKDNVIRNARAVLFRRNVEIEILLVKEIQGNWGTPGGCKEIEDGNIETTINRELKEELTLSSEKFKIINKIEVDDGFQYTNPISDRFGKKVLFEMFLIEYLGTDKDIIPTSEIDAVKWVTKEEALKLITEDDTKNRLIKCLNLLRT